jgi:putative molybdopterin biosynthesis protein
LSATGVENRLAEVRKRRGIAAADLARLVQVSRQTIYAIEAGTYVPNTEVALRLARELETPLDELFTLRDETPRPPGTVASEVLSASKTAAGQAVRVCQVGSRLVSVPVSAAPFYLPEADGLIHKHGRGDRVEISVFPAEEAVRKRLVIAGCDPATDLLARAVERAAGVEIVSAAASSRLALRWLKEGKVHIAGSHLEDPKSGEFNLPFIRRELPGEDLSVVTFASWEEGLVVRAGNPKGIRKAEDLARTDITFVNREAGSGSRDLLDSLLRKAGIAPASIHGYDRVAHGHLPAAYAVAFGEADACIATGSAARAFGLDFVSLRSERYDLVMRKDTADLPAVKAFLDVLQLAALRRKLEVLAGYDTSRTGMLVT